MPRPTGVNVTRVCDVADFAGPGAAAARRFSWPEAGSADGDVADQREWIAATATAALLAEDLGPGARVVTVGAGVEPVLAAVADRVARVAATEWSVASGVPFPEASFDAVVCGPIEGVADVGAVQVAAAALGRLVRLGGVLSVSTRLRLHGPPGSTGWPGEVLLLSSEELERHVVAASGLTLVGELPDGLPEPALVGPRDVKSAAATDAALGRSDAPTSPVAVVGGHVFTMVHLLLRKTKEFDMKPSPEAAPPGPAERAPAGTGRPLITGGWGQRVVALQQRLATVDGLLLRSARQVDHMSEADYELRASLAGFEEASRGGQDRLTDALATRPPVQGHDEAGPDGLAAVSDPTPCTVGLAEGLVFSVMVDRSSADPITTTFLTGYCLFQNLVSLMLELVAPGDGVLDVGAHLGTFTLAAAAAGCPVLAIEASPGNVRLLRESVARNGFHDAVVVSAAASDEPGVVQFCPIGPWGTVVDRRPSALSVEVPMVTIDELASEMGFPRPRFVKMDVEGSEIRSLQGMSHLLSLDDAPALLLESNGHTLGLMGADPSQLLGVVEGFGYTAYMVDRSRLVPVSSADLQPRTEVDYLALKQWPASLKGWELASPLTTEERVAMLVEDCRSESEDCRAYIARAIGEAVESAGTDLLGHDELRAALDRLAEDPVDTVRGAVAWWSPAARS